MSEPSRAGCRHTFSAGMGEPSIAKRNSAPYSESSEGRKAEDLVAATVRQNRLPPMNGGVRPPCNHPFSGFQMMMVLPE